LNIKGLLGALIASQVTKAMTRGGPRGSGGGGGALLDGLSRTLGGGEGTAIAGTLGSLILGSKRGRSVGGGMGKLGGLAVVGSLAWNAYQAWQSQQSQAGTATRPSPGGTPLPAGRPASFLDAGANPFGQPAGAVPPQGSPLAPDTESGEEELSRVFIRAMIAAAKADGHIDAAEEAAIGGELQKLPLEEADRAFVMAEVQAPLDIDRVARGADSPELAAAVYTASLLAITVDTDAERSYLAALAERLRLDPGLVSTLHAKVDEAAPAG
jgi:uncharacterized membrane protein YebE (DUF533 family)